MKKWFLFAQEHNKVGIPQESAKKMSQWADEQARKGQTVFAFCR